MGRLKSDQGQLFYEFHLGDAVAEDHLVRRIDTSLDLSWLRSELAPHYSSMGRPSIDPELMIRMLVVGYVFAIRSERLICREVQVNLAYRWFCRLGVLVQESKPGSASGSTAVHARSASRGLCSLGDLGNGGAAAAGSGLYRVPGLPGSNHPCDCLVTLGILWTALVAALSLGLGLPVRLPAPTVVIVLAGDRREHVEQHTVDRFEHAASELVASLRSHHPRCRQVERHDPDALRRQLGLERFPIGCGEAREAVETCSTSRMSPLCASPRSRDELQDARASRRSRSRHTTPPPQGHARRRRP